MTDFASKRRKMVENELAGRGIRDPAVLAAFAAVPREAFVSRNVAGMAYADVPLPIAGGQTISQPYVVALMIEALELSPGDRVLEVGTGSGYAAAILSQIAAEVYSVERLRRLATKARSRLVRLGYDNTHVRHGDGTLGWPDHAPYDAIIVSAASPGIPEALQQQLAVAGRLVIPVGERLVQQLVRLRRLSDTDFRREDMGPVRFVPLIGAQGWEDG